MATVITFLQIPVRPEFVTEESKNPTFPRRVDVLSGSFPSERDRWSEKKFRFKY
jgi:hypothetical protein